MRRAAVTALWELRRNLVRRAFLWSTLLTPALLAVLVLMPTWFYHHSQANRDLVIGMVEMDTTGYFQDLSERISATRLPQGGSTILLEPILLDTTWSLRRDFVQLDTLQNRIDSLDERLNTIKERRNYVFQRPASETRTRRLAESYQEMRETREQRDFAEIEFSRIKTRLDTLVRHTLLERADSHLRVERLDGYLLIHPDTFSDGMVEFHSQHPINFLRLALLRDALQVTLVEERMAGEGITVEKIQEMLEPIVIQEYLLEGTHRHEFRLLVTYLVPVLVVLFLLTAQMTATGLLMRSLSRDKSERTSGFLQASAAPWELIAGKVAGIGVLGLLQIAVWMALFLLAAAVGLVPLKEIGFFTPVYAGLFVLYFLLGYLLFGAFYGMTAVLTPHHRAGHPLKRIMHGLAVLPVLFMFIVLLTPDSLLTRFLSFVPILTPAFMMLRIPLSHPPVIDLLVSAGIMVLLIIIGWFVAARLYRAGAVQYHHALSFREIGSILRGR